MAGYSVFFAEAQELGCYPKIPLRFCAKIIIFAA